VIKLATFRIGHGFDVHGFEPGESLVLGGVKVPFNKTFKAHSDGDVLLHAVCDALLGAIAEGDIGRHFPDDDDRFKNIDSRLLLKKVYEKVAAKGYVLGNLDVTVIAEKPRLAEFMDSIKSNIANDLSASPEQVNVKATTSEGFDATGREECIAVHAIVLLEREPS
jgi:2-C-methyl-D-erythritol 2,4-cyclodiphosphate synthase